jgi:hypothetical protein
MRYRQKGKYVSVWSGQREAFEEVPQIPRLSWVPPFGKGRKEGFFILIKSTLTLLPLRFTSGTMIFQRRE